MKLFVDTNVLIDSLARRSPHEAPADLLLALGSLKEHELWMSASQFTDVMYILTASPHKAPPSDAKATLEKLLTFINVCHFTVAELEAVLKSDWDDFEDACLYACAVRMRVDAIITRDARGFQKSRIPAMDCAEFFRFYERTRGVRYDFASH